MNSPELHDAFAAYLQVRYHLGERQLDLAGEAVRQLRQYRRPGAAAPEVRTPVPQPGARPAPAAAVRFERAPVPEAAPAPEPSPEPEVFPVPGGTREEQLTAVAEGIRASVRCRALFQRSRNMVFGTGPADARLMFIGEAPGEEEDAQGIPFVGKAGQLLDKMIATMGLTREGVYIANVCKFRPDMPMGASGNRKPTPQEMQACLPFLRAQIAIIRPQVIVALGATAVEGLFQMPRAPIMKMRGTWLERDGCPVMPTYHPAYLLRNESLAEKRKVWEDLLQVMEKLGLPITSKQRGFFVGKSA